MKNKQDAAGRGDAEAAGRIIRAVVAADRKEAQPTAKPTGSRRGAYVIAGHAGADAFVGYPTPPRPGRGERRLCVPRRRRFSSSSRSLGFHPSSGRASLRRVSFRASLRSLWFCFLGLCLYFRRTRYLLPFWNVLGLGFEFGFLLIGLEVLVRSICLVSWV